ncbi:hypothetical protein BU204_19345 [Actinophytocola xanthii]|uniref:Uncharacterized protein n=1 Tax=Actinophytocola xanthii TaxID=1912961 RepID=A0A1Q8CND4_9PSEU|nr:hypothetical protein BU204_19345 [Actinophytocola xanthii]
MTLGYAASAAFWCAADSDVALGYAASAAFWCAADSDVALGYAASATALRYLQLQRVDCFVQSLHRRAVVPLGQPAARQQDRSQCFARFTRSSPDLRIRRVILRIHRVIEECHCPGR